MNSEFLLNFDVPMKPVRVLRSGSLTCLYQDGKLRYIRYNEVEMVRTIYAAVRDENWNTARYTISDENIAQNDDGFTVSYTALHEMNEIHYETQISIHAQGNSITFSMKGRALSAFRRNRIGICVLHSIPSLSGKDVTITTPSGEQYNGKIPRRISPHQPVKDIARMQWDAGMAEVDIRFNGDTFEMEDQRNWTDSSFKTYSTPLDLPMPVAVEKNDTVEQEVIVKITPGESNTSNSSITSSERKVPFPLVGFSRAASGTLTSHEITLLKGILFDHYRAEIDLTTDKWKDELRISLDEATQLKVHLQLTCFFNRQFEQQLIELIEALIERSTLVYSILIVEKSSGRSEPEAFKIIYERLKQQYPSIKLGYGTNNHFADLNRNLPRDLQYDFVSFGLTPQAHLTDTLSMLENLDNQVDLVETIQEHLGNVEIHISPLTINSRKSAYRDEEGRPADFDERQHSEFGAAWVLRALKNLGGTHVSLFDMAGHKGIVTGEHAAGGEPVPLFNILKELKSFQPVHFLEKPGDDLQVVLESGQGEKMKITLEEKFKSYFSSNQ